MATFSAIMKELPLVWFLAAFWVAVVLYRGERPIRFVGGLLLGAAFAHLGWAVLHWSVVGHHPQALLDPSIGYCVLFFPLGPLLAAPQSATWRVLPLALAVARLGCLFGGCCQGIPAAWGTHPTALYEIVLLIGLHVSLSRAPNSLAAPCFLLGFGLIRLVLDPLRALPPLGAPAFAPSTVAACWATLGLLWTFVRVGSARPRAWLRV